jgi:hypothetical protein
MKEKSIWDGRMQVFLASLLGSWILTAYIVHVVATKNWHVGESSSDELMLATAIWAIVFFWFSFSRFVKDIEANVAEIWANPFISEVVPKAGSFTGMEELHGQTALRTGPNLIYPWMYPIEGGILATNKKIIADIPTELFKTLDEKQLEISGCRIVLTVLTGYEVNHFRYIVGHGPDVDGYEELKKYFVTEVRAFLQEYIITRKSADIQSGLEEFKIAFKKQFGGADEIDEREERTGTWTGEPSFGRVQVPQVVRDAQNLEDQMSVVERLYRKILGEDTGMKPEAAWRMALAFAGKLNVNVEFNEAKIEFVGAENLPPGLAHMNLGSLIKTGIGGGKGGGKGGGGRGGAKPGDPLPPTPPGKK